MVSSINTLSKEYFGMFHFKNSTNVQIDIITKGSSFFDDSHSTYSFSVMIVFSDTITLILLENSDIIIGCI